MTIQEILEELTTRQSALQATISNLRSQYNSKQSELEVIWKNIEIAEKRLKVVSEAKAGLQILVG